MPYQYKREPLSDDETSYLKIRHEARLRRPENVTGRAEPERFAITGRKSG
jgi:hypothetical protein